MRPFAAAQSPTLEAQLQAELDRTWAARSEHRVGVSRFIWRDAGTTELTAGTRIATGVCEVGTVEKVEEVHPELCAKPFLELPVLGNREIHIVKRLATEEVGGRVTHSSVSGGESERPYLVRSSQGS